MEHKKIKLIQRPRRTMPSSNYGIFKNLTNAHGGQDSQYLKLEEKTHHKQDIKTKEKTLNDLSNQIEVFQKTTERNFKDVGDKQDGHHTEQMADHQKTRDELLIDNGKLQEKMDTLTNKVNNGWKDPRNWPIPFAISIIAGLVMLAVQNFS